MKALIEYWEVRLGDPDCQRRCQCACGRYQRLKCRGITCPNCSVVVDVRRAPWFIRAVKRRLHWLTWTHARQFGGVVQRYSE